RGGGRGPGLAWAHLSPAGAHPIGPFRRLPGGGGSAAVQGADLPVLLLAGRDPGGEREADRSRRGAALSGDVPASFGGGTGGEVAIRRTGPVAAEYGSSY